MARRTPPRRNNKGKDSNRRGKKKISPLTIGKIEFVDYKDSDLLRKFVSERAKLKPRRMTGNSERSHVRSRTHVRWPSSPSPTG